MCWYCSQRLTDDDDVVTDDYFGLSHRACVEKESH